MKTTLRHILFTLVIGAVACGCVDKFDRYSGDFRNIDPEGWAYMSPLDFSPAKVDSIGTGALLFSVRHSNLYPYSNLYIEVDIANNRDTFNIILADKFGRWHGRGIGTSFQLADTLYRSISLTKDSKVGLRHIMRVDTLPEIEQIGLSFIVDK